jgi:hypothetical protein
VYDNSLGEEIPVTHSEVLLDAADGWKRISFTGKVTVDHDINDFFLFNISVGTITTPINIEVFGMQLETGNTVTTYQPTDDTFYTTTTSYGM